MTSLFRFVFGAYSRLIFFAAGLLLGIQVPSFVEQYRQRVDAHFQEVSINISGFQRTADLLFDGDLGSLISYYESSDDAVFESDADSIRLIVERYQLLAAEQAAMQNGMLAVAAHIALSADPDLLDETLAQYSYTVPLNSIAIQWGLALAIIITLLIDLCLFGCVRCARLLRRRPGAGQLPG